MKQEESMNPPEQAVQPENTLETLRLLLQCGHYLHHHWGRGRASQFRVLRILEELEPLTQRQLQTLMEIGQGSLSELLKKMEDQGYIARSCGPEDRRQRTVRLTPEGQECLRAHRETRKREDAALLSVLTAGEQDQLRTMLSRLRDSWKTGREEQP